MLGLVYHLRLGHRNSNRINYYHQRLCEMTVRLNIKQDMDVQEIKYWYWYIMHHRAQWAGLV